MPFLSAFHIEIQVPFYPTFLLRDGKRLERTGRPIVQERQLNGLVPLAFPSRLFDDGTHRQGLNLRQIRIRRLATFLQSDARCS